MFNLSPTHLVKDCDINVNEMECDYDESISNLKLEWKRGKKRNPAVIKELMARKSVKRNEWIMEESPLVRVVLSKFPVLRDIKVVS